MSRCSKFLTQLPARITHLYLAIAHHRYEYGRFGGYYSRCHYWRRECARRWGWGGWEFRRCLWRHGCGGGGSVPNVIWINEFHYDNVGADVNEFIEVAGTAGLNLADYQLVLYNGNGGVVYTTTTLSGTIDNEGTGFGAVSFAYPVNGIQNGGTAGIEPDGIALYQISTNSVIQFISYEGSFQAAGGPANGIISVNVGVMEDNPVPAAGGSIQLTGSGPTAASFTWSLTIDDTPGS